MNDAKHSFIVQSMIDLPGNFRLDIVVRYLDYIPQSFATARVNEYFSFDTRIAWEYKQFELSVVGQNLWQKQHAEFGAIQIPTSVYGRVAFRL
jgi:iron complex outermembrane receptor protein